VIALLLAIALAGTGNGGSFPVGRQTDWMRPDAVHLELGMSRESAEAKLAESHWTLRDGKEPGQVMFDYDERRTVTMSFVADHLQSIRFELVDFIPAIGGAFSEIATRLEKDHGDPDRKTDELLIYDASTPRIYVVASTRSDTSFGKQGLGFLAARYFLPPN